MRLIEPSYEIITNLDILILQHLEMAGRVCYKSEVGSTQDFVKKRIETGHESVIEHAMITIKFICDRGVSHELVRHRLASFSQESTRFCNYTSERFGNQLTYIIPCWLNLPEGEYNQNPFNGDSPEWYWFNSLDVAESSYSNIIKSQRFDNWTAQQARSVLPNSLKTELFMSANLREWRTIFKQRTSKAAHPQMRELMVPLLKELKQRLPVIFDDIIPFE